MNISNRKRKAALKEVKSDVVFKDANIIDVYSHKLKRADVAVVNHEIVGVGSYCGNKEIDCGGKYLSPGFINGHVHIESSLSTPIGFEEAVIPFGTTTAITDPHEVANVKGIKAIEYFLKSAHKSDFNMFVMAPSCVPATEDEDNGATLTAQSLLTFKDDDKVLGLGEVMDVDGLLRGKKTVLDKISKFKDMTIDGHAPQVTGEALQAYRLFGITDDHESVSEEEIVEKLSAGFFILIREGSTEKNLKTIVKCILKKNLPIENFGFCTDDKHMGDILEEGDVSANIKKAIQNGLDPISAYVMATKNTANHYRLDHLGAIVPSKQADIVILDDLNEVDVNQVWIKGKLVYSKASGKRRCINDLEKLKIRPKRSLVKTVHIKEASAESFEYKLNGKKVDVIEVIPGQIVTDKKEAEVDSLDDLKSCGINKIAVLERHSRFKNSIGIGFVKGIPIRGAAASTVSHDSHNLIVTGDSDEDMAVAANTLKEVGGGYVLVENRKVKAILKLPICGLLSDRPIEEIAERARELQNCAVDMGCPPTTDLFSVLSFLSLTVVPHIKITNRGYVEFNVK